MDRTSNIIIAMAVIAGLLGFALGGWLSMERSDVLREGQRYEDFELPDVNGRNRRLSELEGRVIVLNFWATWCPPCRDEIPDFIALHEAHRGNGVRFVGLSIDSAANVADFRTELDVPYPLLVGNADVLNLATALGNPAQALPFTLILDRQGLIRHARVGRLSKTELAGRIDALLD